MHEALAIETIQSAALRVFATMLGKELQCGTPHPEPETSSPMEGVIAQISVVGSCSIISLVCCSAEVACAIASAMLMQECSSVDAEVLDAMAEIANMVMGNVKTDLDAQLGVAVNLSIPTVTFGRNFCVHNHSKRWVIVPFDMEGEAFTVRVCFEAAVEERRAGTVTVPHYACTSPSCPLYRAP